MKETVMWFLSFSSTHEVFISYKMLLEYRIIYGCYALSVKYNL